MDKNIIEKSPIATVPQTSAQAMIEVETSREVAEVQASLVIAKRFPRDLLQAIDRIKTTCQRQGLAEKALYSYARGGSDISGPSIRLAEALAQNWGNIDYGIRELEQRNGESTVEAYAWDKETNVRQVKIFQVKHKRYTRSGAYDLTDPRDIYEMTANQGARRLRACLLGVIPGDIVEDAVKECENTLKAKADTSPEALKKMLAAFEPFKVTREMIEKRIQRKLEAITPAQFIHLKKIYNSLNDNMSVAADWFEIPAETATTEKPAGKPSLKDTLKKKQQTQAQTQQVPAPSAESQTEATPDPTANVCAPGECPDNPGTTYTVAHCDKCLKRKGCPVWA